MHPGLKVGTDGAFIADAAADLDRQIGKGSGDGADRIAIDRLAGKGAVEVDQMQPLGAGRDPTSGHLDRVIGEHGLVLHPPLAQAHAAAVLEVDCGNQQHRGPSSGRVR